jgi:hypothetical protein
VAATGARRGLRAARVRRGLAELDHFHRRGARRQPRGRTREGTEDTSARRSVAVDAGRIDELAVLLQRCEPVARSVRSRSSRAGCQPGSTVSGLRRLRAHLAENRESKVVQRAGPAGTGPTRTCTERRTSLPPGWRSQRVERHPKAREPTSANPTGRRMNGWESHDFKSWEGRQRCEPGRQAGPSLKHRRRAPHD